MTGEKLRVWAEHYRALVVVLEWAAEVAEREAEPTVELDWTLPVKDAGECGPCPDCGEPWCEECGCHYADCRHPGPMSERAQ